MLKRITTTLFFAITAAWAAGNPEGVPQEAKETAPGVYRLVDKDGKAWIYRKTPFGYSKKAEGEAAAPQAAADGERARMTPFGEPKAKAAVAVERSAPPAGTSASAAVKTSVVEQGDTLHFERPTPFGTSKWSKKKSELTAEEQRIWDEHRASSGAETKAK